jgi:hypothetical protein
MKYFLFACLIAVGLCVSSSTAGQNNAVTIVESPYVSFVYYTFQKNCNTYLYSVDLASKGHPTANL